MRRRMEERAEKESKEGAKQVTIWRDIQGTQREGRKAVRYTALETICRSLGLGSQFALVDSD